MRSLATKLRRQVAGNVRIACRAAVDAGIVRKAGRVPYLGQVKMVKFRLIRLFFKFRGKDIDLVEYYKS